MYSTQCTHAVGLAYNECLIMNPHHRDHQICIPLRQCWTVPISLILAPISIPSILLDQTYPFHVNLNTSISPTTIHTFYFSPYPLPLPQLLIPRGETYFNILAITYAHHHTNANLP